MMWGGVDISTFLKVLTCFACLVGLISTYQYLAVKEEKTENFYQKYSYHRQRQNLNLFEKSTNVLSICRH